VPKLAAPESKREAVPQREFAQPPTGARRLERVAPRPAPAQPMASPPSTLAPEAPPAAGMLVLGEDGRAAEDRTPVAGSAESDSLERRRADADRPHEAARDEAPRKKAVAEGETRDAAADVLARRFNLAPADHRYFALLKAAVPRDAAAARALRDSWRAFALENPTHAGVDEARVRAVEAGLAAFRLAGDPRDLEGVRSDGNAYLERPDAAQPDRVRALLRSLEK
jgi:hypothetical protein